MKRSEQQVENTWNLNDIFTNEEEFKQAIQKENTLCNECMKYSGQLNNPTKLLEYLKKFEELYLLIDDTYGYAFLLADQDNTNSHNQELKGLALNTMINIYTNLAFANVQIMQIEDLESFYKEEPILERYRIYLNEIVRLKPHTLSQEEETLLSRSTSMAQSPYEIYSMLSDADLRYKDAIDSKGEKHALTSGTFIHLLQNSDEELRKSTYTNYYASYAALIHTFAACLNGQCQQLKFFADAKKYPSSFECAMDENNVSSHVYTQLIDSVHKNIHVLHKYIALRKKVMKKDKLHMYDLYVPLQQEYNTTIEFDQAKEDCYNSIKLYGNEYSSVYRHGLDSRWIDVYENEGKASGAYSSGQRVHPYVLMNYEKSLDSVFTLAHEMGHSMHSYLSNKYQAPLDSQYKIFVAEVASTCNEALLMNYLRKKNKDPQFQAYLINYFMEQFRTTLFRQCMFAEFEKIINEKVARHETLTSDSLNQIYKDLNHFYYGDDVILDEEISMEWARIPHFYMNFYVYQYATGFSASMALSQKLIHGTQQDVENYLTFLKGGCTQPPVELLKIAGVDMESEKPVQEAIDLFDSLIDEFNELINA